MTGTSDYLEFDEINPHLGLWQSETSVSASERAWEAWLTKVERALGPDPKGRTDEMRETLSYSIDYALDAFNDGMEPKTFAAEVRAGDHTPIAS
jgi:hypothetical protein